MAGYRLTLHHTVQVLKTPGKPKIVPLLDGPSSFIHRESRNLMVRVDNVNQSRCKSPADSHVTMNRIDHEQSTAKQSIISDFIAF